MLSPKLQGFFCLVVQSSVAVAKGLVWSETTLILMITLSYRYMKVRFHVVKVPVPPQYTTSLCWTLYWTFYLFFLSPASSVLHCLLYSLICATLTSLTCFSHFPLKRTETLNFRRTRVHVCLAPESSWPLTSTKKWTIQTNKPWIKSSGIEVWDSTKRCINHQELTWTNEHGEALNLRVLERSVWEQLGEVILAPTLVHKSTIVRLQHTHNRALQSAPFFFLCFRPSSLPLAAVNLLIKGADWICCCSFGVLNW